MFLRLLLQGDLVIDELAFIWLSRARLERLNASVYTTNPAYSGAQMVTLAELSREYPRTGLARPWYFAQRDPQSRHRLMLERQAEAVVVRESLPMAWVLVTEMGSVRVCADPLANRYDAAARAQYRTALSHRPMWMRA
jgi:hypothetical protein